MLYCTVATQPSKVPLIVGLVVGLGGGLLLLVVVVVAVAYVSRVKKRTAKEKYGLP
jgi:preprotein translocase subunit SecY